jgi:hypothetical protein
VNRIICEERNEKGIGDKKRKETSLEDEKNLQIEKKNVICDIEDWFERKEEYKINTELNKLKKEIFCKKISYKKMGSRRKSGVMDETIESKKYMIIANQDYTIYTPRQSIINCLCCLENKNEELFFVTMFEPHIPFHEFTFCLLRKKNFSYLFSFFLNLCLYIYIYYSYIHILFLYFCIFFFAALSGLRLLETPNAGGNSDRSEGM